MTVAATNNKDIYSANGVQRNWDITFPFLSAIGADIEVYITDTANDGADTLLDSNYEVDVDNSRVVYPTVVSGLPLLQTGWSITIRRVEPLTQQTNLRPQGAFSSANIEAALDKLTMITQQHEEALGRCVQYPVSQDPDSTDTTEFLATILGYRTDAQTAATAAAASQAAAASSASAASTSASTASSAASAASASASAASASASAASSSASSASTSASTATTQASAASSSASAASTSASTATTQASNASSSASAASASASAASSSASSASASASAAAQSAIDAATAAAGVLANPMTTAGDIIYGVALGAPERLAKNASANTVLHSGTVPSWSAVVEADITLADNTTNDVSTTKHGFVPKAPNDTTKFLRGDATWSVVSSAGRILQVDYFTASGTWTKPSGCTQAVVVVVGGGGGGAGGTTSYQPGGGGGGTCIRFITSGLGSTETVTIGAGGAGGISGALGGDHKGVDGGLTSFGSHLSASGGEGGYRYDQSKAGRGGAGTPSTCISFNMSATTDGLSLADSADWNFASSDFTIETFVFFGTTQSGNQPLFVHSTDGSNYAFLRFDGSSSRFRFNVISASVSIIDIAGATNSAVLHPYRWYHLALCRYGNDYNIWLDGVSVASGTDSSAYPNYTGILEIGSSTVLGGQSFVGAIKGYRISNIARYTATFTPPTAAFTDDANTKLLILANETHGATTFVDSEGTPKTITTVGNTIGRYVKSPFAQSTDRLNLDGENGAPVGTTTIISGEGGASGGGYGFGGRTANGSMSQNGGCGLLYGGGGAGAHGDGYNGGDGAGGLVVVYSIA